MPRDNLRPSVSRTSRREFLAATAAATAGLAGVECKDTTEPVVDLGSNPDNLKAVIDGVTSPLQMTRLGGFGTETVVSGATSTPKELIESYQWYSGNDGLEGHTRLISSGEELELKFPFTETVLELKVRGGQGGRSQDSEKVIVEVIPPVLSGTNYEDTQIAFFRYEEQKGWALCFMDRDSPELVSRIVPPPSTADYFDIAKITWAPTAEELAYVIVDGQSSNNSLTVSNTLAGEERIITRGLGLTTPDWSPKGDWLAYRTNERDSFKVETALIRPDGSEKFFLSGESYRDSYGGVCPRFDSTGERLASGGFISYEIVNETPVASPMENIRIFDDLWGTPHMRELLGHDQLHDFANKMCFEELGRPIRESEFYAIPGYFGSDWSPDGIYIVFQLDMVEHDDQEDFFEFRGIVRAEVDNQDAEIELLVKQSMRSLSNIVGPSYSPDGSSIFYGTSMPQNAYLNRMDPDGNNRVNLTQASGAPNGTKDVSPARR